MSWNEAKKSIFESSPRNFFWDVSFFCTDVSADECLCPSMSVALLCGSVCASSSCQLVHANGWVRLRRKKKRPNIVAIGT